MGTYEGKRHVAGQRLQGQPYAHIVRALQHDPLTAAKRINKLLDQGIEVHRAPKEFTVDGRVYGAGSFVVSMAQPKMGVARRLPGQTFYPDKPTRAIAKAIRSGRRRTSGRKDRRCA